MLSFETPSYDLARIDAIVEHSTWQLFLEFPGNLLRSDLHSFITTVISTPTHERAVFDAGSKAAGPDACGFGVFVPPTVPSGKLEFVKTMDGKLREDLSFDSRIGEKYALIERKGGHNLKVGDKVEVVP